MPDWLYDIAKALTITAISSAITGVEIMMLVELAQKMRPLIEKAASRLKSTTSLREW